MNEASSSRPEVEKEVRSEIGGMAIRRSLGELAEQDLVRMAEGAPAGALRTLIRAIVDDVGIVNPALLSLAGDLAGRIEHADKPPFGWLMQQGALDAALSVKCRCAPDLLVIARHEPRLAEARTAAQEADDATLLRIVGMRSVDVCARAIAFLALWARLGDTRVRGDESEADSIHAAIRHRLRAPRWLHDVVLTLSGLRVSDATPLLPLVWAVSGATADGRIALPFDQPPRLHRTALSLHYEPERARQDMSCATAGTDDDLLIADFLSAAPSFARALENASDDAVAGENTPAAITRAVIERMETLRVHQRHLHPGTLDILTRADHAALVAAGAVKGASERLFDAFAADWPTLHAVRRCAPRIEALARAS